MVNQNVRDEALDNNERITLNLLDVVEENSHITQRSLAAELGVALGLTNAYLKSCAKKGFIKVKQIPSNRYGYYLTPDGFAEKTRLSAEYLKQSFNFFRLAKQQSSEILRFSSAKGWDRIGLLGKSDLTEITILSAKENNIDLLAIIDAEAAITTPTYMNIPLASNASDSENLDALIVTNMENPQKTFDEASQFFPRERILTFPLLGVNRRLKNKIFDPNLNQVKA